MLQAHIMHFHNVLNAFAAGFVCGGSGGVKCNPWFSILSCLLLHAAAMHCDFLHQSGFPGKGYKSCHN